MPVELSTTRTSSALPRSPTTLIPQSTHTFSPCLSLSQPFIVENSNGATLYIPSAFFSWDNGAALDEKIPLLRSEVALQRETLHLFSILKEAQHTHVHMDAGLEQEFFLIDRKYYLNRPDLMVAGRTVVGAPPPKGQELEDQYFAHISTRFLDCIHDFEVGYTAHVMPMRLTRTHTAHHSM